MYGIEYARPQTLAETVAILDQHGREARLLAGGTDLIVGLRDHSIRPALVVDAKRVPELRSAITTSGGQLTISADTVMAEVAADLAVRHNFPALAEAAGCVGGVQIRNRATLVGNICNASPAADTAPALIVYQATVVTCGPAGTRRIAITDFLTGPGRTALARGEFVTAIEIPVPGAPAGSAYCRLARRRGADLASVSVAVLVDDAGRTWLGLGAVGPRPLLAVDDSGLLADPDADPARQAHLLASMTRAAQPISDVRASRAYRLSMLGVLIPRALAVAMARRAEGGR